MNQNDLEILLNFIASGSKIKRQVDAVMTVTGPNSETSSQSKNIVYTINDNSHNTSFKISSMTLGHCSVFFELTSPNKCWPRI